jgi:hypothetical protein
LGSRSLADGGTNSRDAHLPSTSVATVPRADLLRAAGSECMRLCDLYRNHPA